VIPAKNEAPNLPDVLGRIPSSVDEVILVDGQSTDVTLLMATSCRPDIRIVHERRPGKGMALQAGFHAATGDVVVAMDADGSMMPDEIPNYVHFLKNGYDFVKGSRFVGGGGSFDITKVRRMGNRMLLAVANHMHGTNFTDLCYGFFAFRRQFLEALGPLSSGFEIEAEITLRALKAGLRIAEIPSTEMPRRNGQSSLHSFPDGARVLRTVMRERSMTSGARS
jgi:glycosyltransferase involved in cell wall biosynthesis